MLTRKSVIMLLVNMYYNLQLCLATSLKGGKKELLKSVTKGKWAYRKRQWPLEADFHYMSYRSQTGSSASLLIELHVSCIIFRVLLIRYISPLLTQSVNGTQYVQLHLISIRQHTPQELIFAEVAQSIL